MASAFEKAVQQICECGDYRSQHTNDGRCRVCGDSKAPYDGCIKFRPATGTPRDLGRDLQIIHDQVQDGLYQSAMYGLKALIGELKEQK